MATEQPVQVSLKELTSPKTPADTQLYNNTERLWFGCQLALHFVMLSSDLNFQALDLSFMDPGLVKFNLD